MFKRRLGRTSIAAGLLLALSAAAGVAAPSVRDQPRKRKTLSAAARRAFHRFLGTLPHQGRRECSRRAAQLASGRIQNHRLYTTP